jgi:lysophospholipase L1-like esterase
MSVADRNTYLSDVCKILKTMWPDNRMVNIVCHGHSVPAGYFATPVVDTLQAYPHCLLVELKARYPLAPINVIVTAIGGENSERGAARFESEVLTHRPDVVTIDYGLNDRGLGIAKAEANWRRMIEATLARPAKVILLTPTADASLLKGPQTPEWVALENHAALIRRLAETYSVGLIDSLAAFKRHVEQGGQLSDLMSWVNHPNAAGHNLVATELMRWFYLP